MITRVITEGRSDAQLLERILSAKSRRDSFRVVSAGGRSSAISLARSFLATRPERVVLVVDSDSNDTEKIEQRRDRIVEALSEVAMEDRYYLALAVPELEAWYFPTLAAASRLLKRPLSECEWSEIRRHPKNALLQALNERGVGLESGSQFLDGLDVDAVAEIPELKALLDFLSAPAAVFS